jgi:hypothetical protein
MYIYIIYIPILCIQIYVIHTIPINSIYLAISLNVSRDIGFYLSKAKAAKAKLRPR